MKKPRRRPMVIRRRRKTTVSTPASVQKANERLEMLKQTGSPVQVVLFMRALLREPIPHDLRQRIKRELPTYEADSKEQIREGVHLLRMGKDPSIAGRVRRRRP